MSISIIPLKKLPFHYANTAAYSWASNTTLTIPAGQYRDTTNTVDLVLAASTTLDTGVVGLNGLDVSTLAASTWYYLYVIGDSSGKKQTGTIASTSASTPYLPFGYDVIAFIGFALTDSSTHFLKFDVTGNGSSHTYMWDSAVSVLSGGSSATYAAVDLSAGVPPVALTEVILNTAFTPNAANDIFSIRKTGSSATTVLTIAGNVAAKVSQSQVSVLSGISSGVAKIDYLVTASGALTAYVLGFRYFI